MRKKIGQIGRIGLIGLIGHIGPIGHIGLIGLIGHIGPIGPIRLIGPIGLITLIFLASCTAEVPQELEGQPERKPVAFTVYTARPTATRPDAALLAEQGIPGGKSIGVYGYYHNNTTWSDAATPNFMFNQQATNEGLNQPFTYSPLKYWPNEETDKVSFIAYYPYCDGTAAQQTALGLTPLLANNGTGLPTFVFTVKDDAAEQVDFLVSQFLPDLPDSRNNLTVNDRVHFYFLHATSKVEFRVEVDNAIKKDLAYFTLNSIQITNICKEGRLTPSYTPPVAPATEGTTALNWASTWGGHTTASIKDFYECQTSVGYLLLPQTLADDAMLEISYDLAFKSGGTTYSYDSSGNLVPTDEYVFTNRTASVQLNTLKPSPTAAALTTWQPNHHYVYVIRLGAKRIDFTGEVSEWGDTETQGTNL